MTRIISFLASTCLLPFVLTATANDSPIVIAVVNGIEITSDAIVGGFGSGSNADFNSLNDDQKSQLIVSLINRQLVLEQAQQEGFDRSKRIQAIVKAITETYVVEQYLIKLAAGFDLGEEAIMRSYSENYSDVPEQYDVSHILFGTAEEAQTALERLANGVDFANLARSESLDSLSAERGGQLGWLNADEMAPSFFNTVASLSEDQVSDRPIRTFSGWHVIRLNSRRNPKRPPLSEVLPQIQQQLIKEQMAAYLEGLREQATIEIR